MSVFNKITEKAKQVTQKASDKFKELKNEFISKDNNNKIIDVDIKENDNSISDIQESKNELSVINIAEVKLDDVEIYNYKAFKEFLNISPTELNSSNKKKINNLFPIPVEQEIIWADCEFDLRCSGVVCTNKGVFIKSNVKPTDEKKKKKKQENNGKSILYFYSWADFNPYPFTLTDEKNTVLKVDPKCQHSFLTSCTNANEVFSKELNDEYKMQEAEFNLYSNIGLEASILSGTNWLNSHNALFGEKNASVNTTSGHGFMAEEMITKLDHLHGINSKVIGGDNAKNGADRYIDRLFKSDIKVQTKYYKTWRGSLDAGFDANTHTYRYIDSNGVPMQLEVPKDQYNQVVEGFKRKILGGHFKDINGNEFFDSTGMDQATKEAEALKLAKKIVRKGRLTYQEAVNLTKPGTIESLKYDALNGVVTCTFAFGLSFVASTYLAYRQTKDIKIAIREGLKAGIRVCGLTFANHMIISQFSRTQLARSFVNAANKNFSRVIRNNIMSAGITIVVYSVPDMIRMFQNKISASQFAKNTAVLAGGVIGGAAGALALGQAAKAIGGEKLGMIGGLVGGIAGGLLGSKVTKEGADIVKEDDDQIFMRIFNVYMSQMVCEYMLDEKEIDTFISLLNKIDSKDIKKLIHKYRKSSQQEEVIREFLDPMFIKVIEKRKKFLLPSNSELEKEIGKLCIE